MKPVDVGQPHGATPAKVPELLEYEPPLVPAEVRRQLRINLEWRPVDPANRR